MTGLRNLTIGAGTLALMALAGGAAAQLGDNGLPPTPQELHSSEVPPPQNPASPTALQSDDVMVRPAAAAPAERIQTARLDDQPMLGTRPVLPARDDPRSVEETADLPGPADR